MVKEGTRSLSSLNSPGSQYSLPPIGSLVRHKGQSAIYLRISMGGFLWIPSVAIFNAVDYHWPHVDTVPDNILVNAGSPKTLVRVAGSPTPYALLNATLHIILSWSDFQNWGFSANAIQPVHYLPFSIDLCRPTFFEGWEGSHKQWFMRQSLHPAWMDAEDELESGATSTGTGDSAHAVASQLDRRWLSVFN